MAGSLQAGVDADVTGDEGAVATAARLAIGRRAVADVVDVVLASVVAGLGLVGALLAIVVTSGGESQVPVTGTVLAWLAGGLGVGAGLLLLLVGEFTGAGPGRRLTRVRVVTDRDGGAPGLRRGVPRALVRLLVVLATFAEPLAGALALVVLLGPTLFGADGRGLHDRLLGTAVVGLERVPSGAGAPSAGRRPAADERPEVDA